MSSRADDLTGLNRGGWQIKRVNSVTGPFVGTAMSDAIENRESVTGQTEVLWSGLWPEDGATEKCNFAHFNEFFC